ncbi:pyridoxamine 5'-phosphate oxidase family protein [Aquipuribacter nitratireducens]|uniref:Pyridoxamine 5'-phosphate oxidase family protein n=1 Tax=Aquipuribacter nitratireducens TaxID=650104 RepID=A0ABW0GK33_9MICO
MTTTTDDGLDLLNDPVAQQLLVSRQPARVAYTWHDGTPRVVPVWFHWDGTQIVVGTPPAAPKVRALQEHPSVSVTIDEADWPYKVLLVRGHAEVTVHDRVTEEYVAAAERYMGPEAAAQWVAGLGEAPMARIAITPEQVRVLDFVTRFPSALDS